MASGDAPTDGNPSHGQAGSGGFLQMPGAAFTKDPQSLAAYDSAAKKWLPVPRAWISPDGTHYAWPENQAASGPVTGIIHIVEIATGVDKPVTVPAPSMPVSYEAGAVFVTRVVPNSDAPPQGLSRIDPATGAFKQVVADGNWTVLGGGFAFGGDVDSTVAPPPANGPGAFYNRVRKLDLNTGAISTVQTFPGGSVRVFGALGPTPILGVQTAGGHFQVLVPAVIYDQPLGASDPTDPVVVDGTTVWFSGHQAIYKWEGSGQLSAPISVAIPLAIPAGACR
ncbi:MAG TPA: hypothetical protein VF160_08005 [Candidatus Dormibacteraeota bacterium]